MNGFLNNMRQGGGLGMSNFMNAMRNTSRNRIQAGSGLAHGMLNGSGAANDMLHAGSGTTNGVGPGSGLAAQTNTVPKSPLGSVPSTIPGGSVPSVNNNMSHYPVQNDNGRYGGLNGYDFLNRYNSGSLWNMPIQEDNIEDDIYNV